MPKKKEIMNEEERSKMLERLAQMRKTVAENRKAKAEAAGSGSSDSAAPPSKPNAEIFANKIEIKKPEPKRHEDEVLAKLDKVATHLEELSAYKKEKIQAKKAKEQEAKVKEEVKSPVPETVKPAVVEPTFQFPRSYGNRFFQGGRF